MTVRFLVHLGGIYSKDGVFKNDANAQKFIKPLYENVCCFTLNQSSWVKVGIRVDSSHQDLLIYVFN